MAGKKTLEHLQLVPQIQSCRGLRRYNPCEWGTLLRFLPLLAGHDCTSVRYLYEYEYEYTMSKGFQYVTDAYLIRTACRYARGRRALSG